MQARTLAAAVAVFGGVGAYLALAPSTLPAAAQSGGTGGTGGLGAASTSTRGVTANEINVVFPVVSLNSLAGKEGFASDIEYGDQTKAIQLYVADINKAGGIHGRKINAIIQTYDPTNQAQMQALCKNWTTGSPAAFAVVDGLGTWEDTNQLCVTQQGHTPMIGQWTTVTDWTKEGSPYLWWTGVDQSTMLQALVNWGLASGRLGGKKVGVLVGDDPADQAALNHYLLPDLARSGITGVVTEEIPADPSETAATNTKAPIAVQQLESDHVQSVIPLVPFNVMVPVLQAETAQNWYPTLLLSDYQSSIQEALGLIPTPFEKALDGQEGVTTLTLGGIDDPRPQSQGGYDPGVRSCYQAWIKKYPKPQQGQTTNYIEEQGPIAAWCQGVRLFAAAAEKAGSNLNRRSFVEAMAQIKNYPGTWSPTLSFGADKRYGPTKYQVVEIHNNVPPSSACITKSNGQPQGTCWVVKQTWQPLPPAS
jgi:ABC-type branched-subunit amino acid transport system substrate-binding protein